MRFLRVALVRVLCMSFGAFSLGFGAWAGQGVIHSVADLEQLLDATVSGWRWHLGDADGAEAPDYDDSRWEAVEVGHRWFPNDSTCWYRARIVLPRHINGIDVTGSQVRLMLGVDNEATAFVNGEFRQQFEWDDGDIVLTDKAEPGASVVVALHCVNRPGYGSLYEAVLVPSKARAMLEAIRTLLNACTIALDGEDYRPASETVSWERAVRDSIAALDFEAYHAAGEPLFMASMGRARDCLVPPRAVFEENLCVTETKLSHLKELLEEGRALGRDLSYARSHARVVESFLQYARDDMLDGDFTHAIRAMRTAYYIDRICKEAVIEATRILEDPSLDRVVPRYHTGPVEIRDGAFWQNGRPLFFTGVGHFGQVRQDVPILNDYGLNIIQIEMGPSSALPVRLRRTDTVDTEAIQRSVVDVLDEAAKCNVMVNLLVSPHYFPQWALEAHPELAQCGYGFLTYCVDRPEARAVIEKWLRALMPLVANHPALHSICLSNEPQYMCRCAHGEAKFRRWLEERYENIDRLNTTYGAHFKDFEAIRRPEGRANYPLYYDWCRFNQAILLEFHEFERGLIHAYAPDLPVHAKVQSLAFADPGIFEKGLDFEALNTLGSISGNDSIQVYEPHEPGEYPQNWLTMAMMYTLQHSIAPHQPIFNSEDHVIQDGSTHFIPAAHIRNCYWMQAIHGQGAATTWVWERRQTGDHAGNILTRAECVSGIGSIALDLQRLAPEVHALQRVKAEAAIFYAFASLPRNMDFAEEAKVAFEGAYFTDTVWDFVTERQALAGKLKEYKLVVAPHAAHVSGPVFETFQKYLQEGGLVVTAGDCFSHDEYGHPRQEKLASVEPGHLIAYPGPLTPRAWREILNGLLEQAGVARPVRAIGPHGGPVSGVHLRTADSGARLLVNLANLTRQAQAVCLKATPPIAEAVDLFTNEGVSFPLSLPPLEPVLLAIQR